MKHNKFIIDDLFKNNMSNPIPEPEVPPVYRGTKNILKHLGRILSCTTPEQILKLPPNPTKDQVKDAYWLQSKNVHPNFYGEAFQAQACEMFRAVNEAYEELMQRFE